MSTIKKSFSDFHESNPHVYDDLVRMCRKFRSRGNTGRIGIGMLFEVLRWNSHVSTIRDKSDFKLNNNFRSRYARLIMKENPDLRDIFQLREIRSE